MGALPLLQRRPRWRPSAPMGAQAAQSLLPKAQSLRAPALPPRPSPPFPKPPACGLRPGAAPEAACPSPTRVPRIAPAPLAPSYPAPALPAVLSPPHPTAPSLVLPALQARVCPEVCERDIAVLLELMLAEGRGGGGETLGGGRSRCEEVVGGARGRSIVAAMFPQWRRRVRNWSGGAGDFPGVAR